MKSNLKLVDGRSPGREALAEAIAQHGAARERLAKLKAAADRASDAMYVAPDGASHILTKAEDALAQARKAEGAFLASVAIGDADASASPVTAADKCLADAQAFFDKAHKTKMAVDDALKAAEEKLPWRKSDLDRAIGAVLGSEAAGFIGATMAQALLLQGQLGEARALLAFQRGFAVDGGAAISNYLAMPILEWEWSRQVDAHPALASWRAAIAALETDADAALPT